MPGKTRVRRSLKIDSRVHLIAGSVVSTLARAEGTDDDDGNWRKEEKEGREDRKCYILSGQGRKQPDFLYRKPFSRVKGNGPSGWKSHIFELPHLFRSFPVVYACFCALSPFYLYTRKGFINVCLLALLNGWSRLSFPVPSCS